MRNVTAQIQTVGDARDPNSIIRQLHSIATLPLGDGTLLPGGQALSFRIPPGHYILQIRSLNGWFTEDINLKLLSKRRVGAVDRGNWQR